MTERRAEEQFFYLVQRGDRLKSISEKFGGLMVPIGTDQEPFPGQLIPIGSPGFVSAPISTSELRQLNQQWERTTDKNRQTILRNFDVLDWLGNRKDEVEYSYTLGAETQSLLRAVTPFKTSSHGADLIELSLLKRGLFVVRANTIERLRKLNISITKTPILILEVKTNGFFSHAQRLSKIIELAERVNLGNILSWTEIGIEGSKVARTAASTRSAEATIKQVGRSSGKIAGGLLSMRGAEAVCRMSLGLGWGGVLVCGLSIAGAIFLGQELGGYGADVGYSLIEGRPLPPLR